MRGLSRLQRAVLRNLSGVKLTEGGIKNALDWPSGGVSRTIENLLARGLIEKVDMGYVSLPGYKITAKGKEALRAQRR